MCVDPYDYVYVTDRSIDSRRNRPNSCCLQGTTAKHGDPSPILDSIDR